MVNLLEKRIGTVAWRGEPAVAEFLHAGRNAATGRQPLYAARTYTRSTELQSRRLSPSRRRTQICSWIRENSACVRIG
jgi:hypothetical protein